jgi:hypothetical protein
MNVRLIVAAWAAALLFAAPAVAQTASHGELMKQARELRAQLRSLEKRLLEPDASDLEAYQELVGKPDSGVIRLLPRPTPRDEENAFLSIRGSGAYYSFQRLTHAYGQGSDIELARALGPRIGFGRREAGRLRISVGFAGADYGWMAGFDADSLDAVALDDPRAAYIASQKPAITRDEVRVERDRLLRGVVVDGTRYNNWADVEIGKVYLLRSIDYDRSDLLVALKAHRQDADDSVIFAWKLLKRFDVPTLKR